MKVVVVNQFTRNIGGTNQVVFDHLEALHKQSIDYRLFSFNNEDLDSLNIYRKFKIILNSTRNNFLTNKLNALLDKFQPDIIHVHNLYPFLFRSIISEIKKKDIKTIIHLHNYYPFCLNSYFYRDNKICTKCLQKNSWIPGIFHKCYHRSFLIGIYASINRPKPKEWINEYAFVSKFIAVSNFVKNKYLEFGLPPEKIKVIYNPLNIKLLSFNKLSLRESDYILYFGSLLRAKGLVTLLKAAELLPDIKFLIAGEGQDKKQLLKIARNLKNVNFIGVIKDAKKQEIINNSKFIVVPSEWWETFGLVVLEANLFGKFVLTSGIGGVKELIEEGKNGYFFNVGDPIDLAKKINWLWCKIPEMHHCQFCTEKARGFSINSFSQEIINTYKTVLI